MRGIGVYRTTLRIRCYPVRQKSASRSPDRVSHCHPRCQHAYRSAYLAQHAPCCDVCPPLPPFTLRTRKQVPPLGVRAVPLRERSSFVHYMVLSVSACSVAQLSEVRTTFPRRPDTLSEHSIPASTPTAHPESYTRCYVLLSITKPALATF